LSSPVKNSAGEIVAVVETMRDISESKAMQSKILEQNRKLKDDLDIARKLQSSMLPKEYSTNRFSFSYLYQPCENLGGDFIDIFQVDDDHTGIYIADVSGHGVAASMLTVFLRSSIHRRLLSPAEVLRDLFRKFNESGFDTETYITVFYAILDNKNNTLTYSNAGHGVAPLLISEESCRPLNVSGIPISNWINTPVYEDYSLKTLKGDRLFLFTDGLVEIRNNKNEAFGEKRLTEYMKTAGHTPPDLLFKKLFNNIMSFSGLKDSSMLKDDLTIAMLEVK
jgi:sigma-B regulation protein RsbU (phosphoserine phosphatase)